MTLFASRTFLEAIAKIERSVIFAEHAGITGRL
jgi:hypothetical protein